MVCGSIVRDDLVPGVRRKKCCIAIIELPAAPKPGADIDVAGVPPARGQAEQIVTGIPLDERVGNAPWLKPALRHFVGTFGQGREFLRPLRSEDEGYHHDRGIRKLYYINITNKHILIIIYIFKN